LSDDNSCRPASDPVPGGVRDKAVGVGSAVPAGEAQALAEALRRRREQIAQRWADLPLFSTVYRAGRDQAVGAAGEVLDGIADAADSGRIDDVDAPGVTAIQHVLEHVAGTRMRAGADIVGVSGEVAQLREPMLAMVSEQLRASEHARGAAVAATALVGTLRAALMERAVSAGSDTIARQRLELREVATPVIKLWDGVLAVPLIGTLDSARTQVVMETLLNQIVEQHAAVAILDITGVPMVDSMIAQHLLKTVMAVRLMGARCVVSGIRPQIAQTVVQLGIDLGDVVTRSTLADALAWALEQIGSPVGSRA
jgi:rsbT co-antagonist protein RsbR